MTKDIADLIPQLYRIFDLVDEEGNDNNSARKIIIAEDGLGRLLNDLCPGAYRAITRIDFKALDSLSVHPIGIYGDRGEIINFLSALQVVDDTTASLLRNSRDNYSGPILRSGIYIVRPSQPSTTLLYAVYWPQDTTWQDNAPQRNRVMFMRYLTKVSDQLLCLMSPAQSKAFTREYQVGGTEGGDDDEDDHDDADDDEDDEDDEDLSYEFEVTKIGQEDSMTIRPGFRVESPLMQVQEVLDDENQPCPPPPRLILGECSQAFLSVQLLPSRIEERTVNEIFTKLRLRDLLASSSIRIQCELDDGTISALVDQMLVIVGRFREPCLNWKERRKAIDQDMNRLRAEKMREIGQELTASKDDIEKLVMHYLVGVILEKFPTLDPVRLYTESRTNVNEVLEQKGKLIGFLKGIQAEDVVSSRPFNDFTRRIIQLPATFLDQKRRIVYVHLIHTNYPQRANKITIQNILTGNLTDITQGRARAPWSFFESISRDTDAKIGAQLENFFKQLSNEDFLENLDDYVKQEPLLEPIARRALELAYHHFSTTLRRILHDGVSIILSKKRHLAEEQVKQQLKADIHEALKTSAELLYQQISSPDADLGSAPVVIIGGMNIIKNPYGETYNIRARYLHQIRPTFQYTIAKLEISVDHRRSLELDPTFIPQPSVNQEGSITFALPIHHQILYARLVATDYILLVVDQDDKLGLYLDNISNISKAVLRGRTKKYIDKSRLGANLGTDVLMACDETKRLLVLCTRQKTKLHVLQFDERFSTLETVNSPVEMAEWYNSQETITHICFVAGTEELLLVDSQKQARVYSLVTRRFWPAFVPLPAVPISVMSSPDAAYALLVFEVNDRRVLNVLHLNTFGASQGMTVELHVRHGSVSVTSFVDRRCIHLLMLDEIHGHCDSLVLTKESLELMLKKGNKASVDAVKGAIVSNTCFIDCFVDVWTRFPVVATVSRHSLTPSSTRQPSRITFVTDLVHDKYASYFMDMVRTFEEQTKKPTDGQLLEILINATTFSAAIQTLTNGSVDTVSQFLVGHWFVNLLCLLPINIAVARGNRFVPLKDGVFSVDFEKSQLGAEVGQIVDNLSFGWYESILRSYIVDKPVRVVSSMATGEKSVGKAFILNHLMDTSFADDAMRKTEGVWMSIALTDEALLVALDFEDLHNIARSPQDDAFLVLFNTAISNLVLFSNSFGSSRDVATLFQPFQTSSTMLGPAVNSSLFQSTLVIIIKDVTEIDRGEIVREFSSELQRLVQAEQEDNFISKHHAGRLNIIPWPDIGSSRYYLPYSRLKRHIGCQKITHPSAREFLHTLKFLMAKLKANDWSANFQSLAAHRARTMLAILPVALQYGFTEAGSDNEPLKNLDNDTVIDMPDTHLRLFLSSSLESSSREAVLADLRNSWTKHDARHDMGEIVWMDELAAYLNEVVKLRIAHVEAWISANLQRFKSSNANVELLQREMANAKVDLEVNVDLCKMTCASCFLSCTFSRQRDPYQHPHDCNTNHRCPHACGYSDDHPDEFRSCNFLAGHDGPHICVVDEHLCGEPCIHSDKKGCQQDCTQMVGHEDDHICSARKHLCGEPCELQLGVQFTCEGTCSFPSDEPHVQHVCDNRMCPLTCGLCKRLCRSNDHLHGLDDTVVHLCGEAHRCQALCAAAGICEIDTTPQSIEATFTGRHETFQYTKYSQAAKRLPCAKPIPAGKHDHEGQHIHSLDPNPFHFCETRCESCGYFCTLPRGHTQQEHDTSHGSMSRTKWAVDGPDGSVMELNGRRFGANDEGAPMMCNLVCQSMGRHAHLDYCRTDQSQQCSGPDHEHIPARLAPNPDRPKDWISHKLYWRRSGFRDPYSRDDQSNFAKCDSMCPGPEHAAATNQPAQPSYCTLPLFHLPHITNQLAGLGYVSSDGHLFSCKNPVVVQQAFHVIFVIDRSGSMSQNMRTPLPPTPVTPTIQRRHNDRLGAVYLSLHGFWQSRQTALTNPGSRAQGQTTPARRDAYSAILFNHSVTRSFENDFQRTPEGLLQSLLSHEADGGTNYEAAVLETEVILRRHWSNERSPVVIFLSGGECSIQDSSVRTLCRASIALGKPLSFHAVSFGPSNQSLRRMAQIAREVESTAPRDAALPANAHVESSYIDYTEVFDSVLLAKPFSGIVDSLKKTRGALMV